MRQWADRPIETPFRLAERPEITRVDTGRFARIMRWALNARERFGSVVELKKVNPYSYRPRRASLGDVAGASLTLLVLCSALGRKREPLREVEPEVIPPGRPLEPFTVVEADEMAAVVPDLPTEPPEPLAIVEIDETEEPLVVDPTPEAAPPERVSEPLAVVEADETEEPVVVEPTPEPAPPPQSPSGPPSLSTDQWTCEIALWTEHDQGVFYARSFHRGDEVTVAESPRFTITSTGAVEESPAAVAAYESLCDDLVRMGWARDADGRDWYGTRFRRDFSLAAVNASLTAHGTSERRNY
jgi:hypothetical protein